MQTHKNEKSFEYIEKLTSNRLIARLNGLAEDLDHTREECLEGFLQYTVRKAFGGKEFAHDVSLIIRVNVLGDDTQSP